MDQRTIGLQEGVALYIATILGSGVLFLTGVTASLAGPASLLSWTIVILLSFPLAYSFACLARKYPDAGGAATFVRKSFGFHSGNMVGWFYFITAAVGQTIVSLTGAFYFSQAFDLSDFSRVWIAILILVIAGLANYNGMKVSGKVAFIFSTALFLLLILTVVASLPYIDLAHFQPIAPNGWYSVGTAITVIFWAFFGWEAICNLAPYFKRPDKIIVRSTMISAVIVGILYLALSFVTIATHTYGSLQHNLSPIGVLMGETIGVEAQLITAVVAVLICIGTSNAFVASLTQLGYSLNRDGAFPKILSVVHARTQVPRRMVAFVILFAIGGVLITEILNITFQDLLFIPTSLGIFVYIFSMAAGIKLLTNRSLGWWSSLLSLLLRIGVLPFFELFIFVPVIVIVIYAMYMTYRKATNRS
ncbi:APC family permease [Virgibacillus halodenitrificans]|uniref:APC family permease n=1 Tax=Virgibacillus halodenitrificans TaxID=1482 RepID=UPI001F4586B5|nr:amino acid permease [Virgibacillus halodenitrificans]